MVVDWFAAFVGAWGRGQRFGADVVILPHAMSPS